jgi:FAD:protein FMN transferase
MKRMLWFVVLGVLSLHAMERTRILMGTFATLSLPDRDASCADSAFAAMATVDKTLSSYDPHAEIYRLNHRRSIPISAMTYDALSKAKRYYVQSGGYFDVTVGAITRGEYHFGGQERVPGTAELAKAPVGFSLLEFNTTHAALKPGAMVDLGGFGKGFGIDRAAEALRACGAKKAVVGLSGDIRCIGGHCLLGIQDPFSEGTLMTFQTLKRETGISTSGNYRRFVRHKAHNHLIDPKTRESEQAFASVTLIGTTDNSDLDAWTTAASVMPPNKALTFLQTLPVAYILVYSDGTIVESSDLSDYVSRVEKKNEDN